MDHLRFAVAIMLPDATASDVARSAIFHNVHIIDKEPFDPLSDYGTYPYREPLANGAKVFALFITAADSYLIDEGVSLEEVLMSLRNT